jgi:hypothetical protein
MTLCRIAAVTLTALLAPLAVHAQDAPGPATQYPAPIVRRIPRVDPSFDNSAQQQIQPAQATPDDPDAPDPALANLAVVSSGASSSQGPNSLPDDPVSYPPAGAQPQPDGSYQPIASGFPDDTDTQADQPPPDLFDYDQPFAPGPFFLWIPGYWAHNPSGFFWVPGQWLRAPFYGALWTPPYWGFSNGLYRFHSGYWGTHIGYYGGVNYGFGYIGTGFFGGYWRDHQFFYNTAVARIPSTITTVYNHATVFHGVSYGARVAVLTSYNGGPAGLRVHPLPFEIAAAREPHLPEAAAQVNMRRISSHNRNAAFSQNQGHPIVAAVTTHTPVPRPGMTPPTILPAENLQEAKDREAHRAESLQRARQEIDARRAAGQPVNSLVTAMPGTGLNRTSTGRVLPATGSTVTGNPARTPTTYSRTETAIRSEPAHASQPVSTVQGTPSAQPEQPAREESRREPEPARVEPAHEERVEPPHEEPVTHSTEPATEPAEHPAEPRTVPPTEPHRAPQHAPLPPPKPAPH